MIRYLLGILIGAALAALAPAAGAQTLERIKQQKTITVGIRTDYRPWGFLDPSGKIIGMEIDLARDVADRLGVAVDFVPVNAVNRMEFLQQGRIDLIIATMGDTPQRRRVVGMVEPNYYASGTNILANRSAKLTRWDQLAGRTVCAVQSAVYNRRISELYKPELLTFPAVPEALNALLAGSCVAFYDSTFIESTLASGDERWSGFEMPFPTEDMLLWAIGLPLGEREGPFGQFMQQVSEEWHRSGKLLELERKWGIKPNPFLVEMNRRYGNS